MKQFPRKWFCTQNSVINRNCGLYPCCCRRSISCCPQRSSPVRSDRWILGPREAVKQAALIVLWVSQGPCGCVCVLPVAPASWTLQRRPGSPPWLRLLSAWWPGCTGSLDPALQPVRQHTQGHCAVICSRPTCCWGSYMALHTSFRILKDSFMAFFTLPSPFTWSSSIRSLKCCNRWTKLDKIFLFRQINVNGRHLKANRVTAARLGAQEWWS